MGCCCSSRRTESVGTSVYFYCPQALEEHEPLSSPHGTTTAISAGLLVQANLRTSSPDTYRAPPAPLPYDLGLACSQTLLGSFGNSGNKSDPMLPTESQLLEESVSNRELETSVTSEEDLKESNSKIKSVSAHGSPKVSEIEPSLGEPVASGMDEEDVCPTCLEEFDVENPRIITKCEHHFHLSCILEWMERSDTCPICDQAMMFNHSFNGQQWEAPAR